jgi:carboxymethylenebutenolidase
MKWLKRVVSGLLAVLALLLLYLGGVNLYEANFGQPSSERTNVTYPAHDGTELHGYLAEPQGDGPHPAVLLIHEWWGLNEGITVLAEALAAQGYLVLAADAYRGEVTDQVARAIVLRTTTPEEQVFSDLDAALDYLSGLEQVDDSRIATMGFCFGGEHSLQLGLRESERLSLTIMYYGAVVTDPDLLRPLTEGKGVLGIFGEEDQSIFTEDVLEFEAALNSLDIPNEITIYEGVGHAFLNEDNYDQPGTAMQAWQQTLAFLEREFGE